MSNTNTVMKNRVQSPYLRVDFNKPISFTFDGRTYQGFAGDTLASALLANGVKIMARSFKYGRPRGIIGAWAEEPNALVQVDVGARTTPDLKATQVELYDGLIARRTTGWPSLHLDLKSVAGKLSRFMPAGFYYKTFKFPISFWPFYERVIRNAAGYGTSPTVSDVDSYDHKHHHVDLLVVGAGASGLMAALLTGRAGLRVILVDDQAELGGYLLSMPTINIGDKASATWVADVLRELQSLPNVTILSRTTAFGLHDMNMIHATELLQDHLKLSNRHKNQRRERLHRIRANQVILATGAFERPLVFGNNDLPGVMTASALATYANKYGVLVGKNIVIMTSNDFAYQSALDLAKLGAQVSIVDTREVINPAWEKCCTQAAIKVFAGYGISKVSGSSAVRGVQLVKLHPSENKVIAQGEHIACEIVASSGGLSPSVHLFCHDGGRPVWDDKCLAFVAPATGRAQAGIYCVGAITGAFGLKEALQQTYDVVAGLLKGANKPIDVHSVAWTTNEIVAMPARNIFRIPDGLPEGHGAKAFVDYQNDVAVTDIQLAIRENYKSIEHIKRYTALGFGTDQGKLSNVNGFAIAAEIMGKSMSEIGTTTYRPAYTPVTFGTLAGPHVGATFEPRRYTAMQISHESRGAAFEPVGQWMRPWYFAQAGEDMHAAVQRECKAARHGVAMLDASTLGKIDIQGRDVREFLNRVYANAWSQLAPGKCRYGLMLDEAGMVMDDGVTACISDRHFLMTTTTGGAARVLAWLEKWHQTEWPELEVYMTSVTDHWATAAVVGPKSREVLATLCTDIDLSKDAFKFMDWFDGTVAGIPARVFRISFSGELAYEVNVDASYGEYMWESLMAAGKAFNITPYGTETMHVLRAEKGFIIVGQDTDGSVTPFDLDMPWAVGMKKPYSFIGKRSFARSDTARTDRKQLVGLLTEDPGVVLKEGAQIIEEANPTLGSAPIPMYGHVTSSYYSVELGRSIAMALIKDGIKRRDDPTRNTMTAWAGGNAVKVKLVSPIFVDTEGVRHHV